MAILRMVSGFRLHETRRMHDTGGKDPKHGSSQLLSMLGSCLFVDVSILSPHTRLLPEGIYRGNSRVVDRHR